MTHSEREGAASSRGNARAWPGAVPWLVRSTQTSDISVTATARTPGNPRPTRRGSPGTVAADRGQARLVFPGPRDIGIRCPGRGRTDPGIAVRLVRPDANLPDDHRPFSRSGPGLHARPAAPPRTSAMGVLGSGLFGLLTQRAHGISARLAKAPLPRAPKPLHSRGRRAGHTAGVRTCGAGGCPETWLTPGCGEPSRSRWRGRCPC
jgi:hypothetical protein